MVSNQLETERKRKGIGYMLPYLRSVSVCLVLFFLFIQPISWVHAVESTTKMAKFPDGWQLVNPPRVVHQRDALGSSSLKRDFNITGIERNIAVPSKKYGITAYGQYVKQCHLTYTHQYTQSQLSCSTIVYNPVTEDDNIQ